MKKKKFDPLILFICLVIVLGIGFLGSIITKPGSWYESIKPKIAPPNYWFGIVWTILYIMIAVSIYIRWIGSSKNEKYKTVLFYGINLLLNLSWSIVFFGFHQTFLAFIVIILIWLSILQLIIWNWKRFRISAYLILPYLLWVSFASILNLLTIRF